MPDSKNKTTIGEEIQRSLDQREGGQQFWPSNGLVALAGGEFIWVLRREEYLKACACEMDEQDSVLDELTSRCEDVSSTPEGIAAIKEIADETGLKFRS